MIIQSRNVYCDGILQPLQVELKDDKIFRINDGNITYFVNSDAYDGPLPEVPFDIPAPVENPTFKPDAKVSAIWITQ